MSRTTTSNHEITMQTPSEPVSPQADTGAVSAQAVCYAENDDYDDFDSDGDDSDDYFDCGMTADGGCMDAGSEHCEFDCPHRRCLSA